jgi:RimJ/RimL family protein N-acetyltransferase
LIEWNHGAGRIELGIAEEKDRRHGYGSETLGLLLRFAFDELNLHSLYAFIPEYNLVALELFRRTGFIGSVRQREAIQRNGRRWDLIYVGILQEEWEAVR